MTFGYLTCLCERKHRSKSGFHIYRMKECLKGNVTTGGVVPLQTDAPKPEVFPVPVWRCRNKECKAWVREELTSSPTPGCPLCNEAMIRSIKHLPKLVKKHKAAIKKKSDEPSWVH
ncbi:MAG: hypothetical protein K0S39_3729 [Paenibacillus sp.]|jgi:hypothetical protein|nr:hypothetical protein [Paenibacillus sp.]